MAGFFSRIGNMWKGFLSLFVQGIENEHPEAVYEAAIQTQIEKYNGLKKAVSGIVYLRNKLSTDLEKKSKELVDIEAQIPVAVQQGEDEVAVVLIERQNSLTAEIASLRGQLQAAEGQAEDAKSSLLSFQAEINKLKREKEEMLAKRANAEARIRIEEQLSGLSTDADLKALEGVRESIHKMEAEADVNKEIGDQSLERKLAKIKGATASSSARAQLEALKKAQQASSAQADAAKKTL